MVSEYVYEADWGRYAYPESGAFFASGDDLLHRFSTVELGKRLIMHGGPPLMVRGSKAVLNDETEHWLIVGETGSKKTRCFVSPLITILAAAKESMIITDVKGELSTNAVLRKCLKANGIRQVFLNFRDLSSDGYNILEHAFDLYCQGKKDKAMMNLTSIVSVLSSKYNDTKSDPFWKLMSEQHLIPIIHILFELGRQNPRIKEYINMLSVSTFADETGTNSLMAIIDSCYKDTTNNSIQMLKNVLSAPEKTRMSIVATTASLLRDFLIQENLLKMLSKSTFDLESLYEQPTCVFMILPDETSAYNGITGLLVDIFYSQLVEVYAEKYQSKKEPPCRVNWVMDEFCNVSVNDMSSKISASRGRLMRFFLVCQSLRQLEADYPDSWSTILGNCKNTLFLQSSDPEMLEYISGLCGTTSICRSGNAEPLLPVTWLRRLKKCREYKEAIYIRDDMVYKAVLPDISQYEHLRIYGTGEEYQIPVKKRAAVAAYTPAKLIDDINSGRVEPPLATCIGAKASDPMDEILNYSMPGRLDII